MQFVILPEQKKRKKERKKKEKKKEKKKQPVTVFLIGSATAYTCGVKWNLEVKFAINVFDSGMTVDWLQTIFFAEALKNVLSQQTGAGWATVSQGTGTKQLSLSSLTPRMKVGDTNCSYIKHEAFWTIVR